MKNSFKNIVDITKINKDNFNTMIYLKRHASVLENLFITGCETDE